MHDPSNNFVLKEEDEPDAVIVKRKKKSARLKEKCTNVANGKKIQ